MGTADRPRAGRRAESPEARLAGAPPRRVPPLRRGAREPSRAPGGVRPLRRPAARAHGAPSADPRPHPPLLVNPDARCRRGGGPAETDMRLALRAGATELQGLLGTLPEPDTVNLAGLFFSRRQVGRSRRGLPLWEEDSYRRWSRVPWGGTTVLYPFGPPGVGQRRVVWVEITVSRAFAAGETRASEETTIIDSAVAFSAQAVIPPRRVTVRMWLVRGDTAASRQVVDLVPETTGRRVSFRLGSEKLDFDVALERPEPPRTGALQRDIEVQLLT